jgi:hypothetical protein
MGFQVTWWDERASSATWYKFALRFFPAATARWSETTFLNRLDRLPVASITHVLVIKGEGLSARIVNEMRKRMASASFGLYLWDGVENVKGVMNIFRFFDSVATFDPVDSKTFGWTYRPLFGRSTKISNVTPASLEFDWCFVGTIHSDRHKVMHRLRKRYGTQLSSFVFAYFQSPLVLMVRLLSDWTLWCAPQGTLSTRAMTAEAVSFVVERSKTVLDIEHPRQRGFTMRTIETLLAEKKLVTTNQHILGCDLYHSSRVHLIDRGEPEIPPEFLAQSYLPILEELRYYYSCEGWAIELLALQDQAASDSQVLIHAVKEVSDEENL